MGVLPTLTTLNPANPTAALEVNDNFAAVRDFLDRELATANQLDADNLATPFNTFAWTGSWEHAVNPRVWASVQMVMPYTNPYIRSFQAYYGTHGAPTSDLTLKLQRWDTSTSTWITMASIVFPAAGGSEGDLQVVDISQEIEKNSWLVISAFDDDVGVLDYGDLSFAVILRDTLQEA